MKKLCNALVVIMSSLVLLSPQEIFSSPIQDTTDEDYYDQEDEDSLKDDYQETSVPRRSHKKGKKLKERNEIQAEEDDDYDDEERSEFKKQKKSNQISKKKKRKKKRRAKQEWEDFAGEEENNGRKISWNLKNWDFKKKNKKKFGKKRRKKKRDYENNNQQVQREPNGWPDGEQLPNDYRMLQRGRGQSMPYKPDWRNEIAADETEGKIYASSKKNSEIILDPIVDSSKLKASSLKVDVQPTIDLAHREKNNAGIRVVEWPHPIQEIETPPQMILSKNTDDELKKISEKISQQKPSIDGKEAFVQDEKSEILSAGKRRRYKATPRESIKLRQELEMYRQMYAESFDEAKAALEEKTQVDVKA